MVPIPDPRGQDPLEGHDPWPTTPAAARKRTGVRSDSSPSPPKEPRLESESRAAPGELKPPPIWAGPALAHDWRRPEPAHTGS
eukprot:3776725-Lingulodinium_polyedra.AAC.1